MADRNSRVAANLVAAGFLLALVAGVLAWQRPWVSAERPAATATVPADARALLAQQFQQLTDARTKADFVAAAGDSASARTTAADIWDARRALGVEDVSFDYRRGGQAADRADGTTSAEVEVAWREGSSAVRFRLAPGPDGFDLVSASRQGDDPLPLWLAGTVEVERTSGATVITVDGGDDKVDAIPLAARAARTVRDVVPAAGGRLTVVAPARPATTAAILGRPTRAVDRIAAVSTVLGGKSGKPAIVLNPELFATMDERAQRVVMAHEATHVLTGVVRKDVALWVAEGFADYVALHDDKEPLSVSAGQILRQVKAEGVPKRLPTSDDFDESTQSTHGLSTTYESAWLAFRMLGERHGDAAVRGFYTEVVAGADVDAAARQWFGTSVAGVTADWQRYLTKSASTVS